MFAIPRMKLPESVEAFEAVVQAGRPVLFEGAVADWPCTKEWTLDYLKAKAGERETMVTVSDNPVFKGSPETGHYTADQMRKMKFGEFLDSIARGQEPGRHLYAHKQPLKDVFPELRDDVRVPAVLQDRPTLLVTMWMGPQGSVTQLHHDMTDNLFAMIRGRKRVRLFDPYQKADFYRFPFKRLNGRTSWHLSHLGSTRDVDAGKFPRFAGAEPIEVVVEPGDMLLIPNFWWHEVESLDQPSISLAYWWTARTPQSIDETLAKITAFAEEYENADPQWRKFIEHVVLNEIFPRGRRDGTRG